MRRRVVALFYIMGRGAPEVILVIASARNAITNDLMRLFDSTFQPLQGLYLSFFSRKALPKHSAVGPKTIYVYNSLCVVMEH